MSKAQLDKFIGLVSNDPAVLQQASKGVIEDAPAFVSNVVQYAKSHGYDFNETEAKEWISEQARQRHGGELSDTQLEMVAGGKAAHTSKFFNELTNFLDSKLALQTIVQYVPVPQPPAKISW